MVLFTEDDRANELVLLESDKSAGETVARGIFKKILLHLCLSPVRVVLGPLSAKPRRQGGDGVEVVSEKVDGDHGLVTDGTPVLFAEGR